MINPSLMSKREMFYLGIGIFAEQVCRGDQGAYLKYMAHEDGYVKAAKAFYEKSGYLKNRERDALYNQQIIPDWMKDDFMKVEKQVFNQTLWDKQ